MRGFAPRCSCLLRLAASSTSRYLLSTSVVQSASLSISGMERFPSKSSYYRFDSISLSIRPPAFSNYYSLQLCERAIKIVIQNNIVKAVVELNFDRGISQTAFDVLRRVKISGSQPRLQYLA